MIFAATGDAQCAITASTNARTHKNARVCEREFHYNAAAFLMHLT